ncbi:MAG TPA: DUF192 domain-containing protein [Polyangiaceae bacterium]|nr:DUF192 domain-containing protein [Polyangiaceae bacterium]
MSRPPVVSALALACALGACSLFGCESRAPEPTPPPRTSPDAAMTRAQGEAADASATAASTGKARCIRPTPDTPAREVKGPVPDPNCPEDDWPKFDLPLGTVHFTVGAEAAASSAPASSAAPSASASAAAASASAAPAASHDVEVAVEIAEKGKEREKGLMFRKSMKEDAGMLFIFEERRDLAFWMENTCIPLDMIFIDSDGTIVGIEENTPTLSRDTFDPGCPAQYVLEVNAGWARRHGVRAGMKARLPRS